MIKSSSSSSTFKIIASALVLLVLLPSGCHAFLNLPFINQANPALAKYAEAQEGGDEALLKIHLDIGQVAAAAAGAGERRRGGASGVETMTGGNRLGIDGLVLELHGNQNASYQQLSYHYYY